jgi:hypothetical protein
MSGLDLYSYAYVHTIVCMQMLDTILLMYSHMSKHSEKKLRDRLAHTYRVYRQHSLTSNS